jgi:hypothetical protein
VGADHATRGDLDPILIETLKPLAFSYGRRALLIQHSRAFPIYLVVGVFLGLSGWAFSAATGSAVGGGAKFLLAVLSIPAVVALIALVLSSIVWIPAGLFLLPAWLFWVVSHPFKVVYFLVVKVPVMVLHYLHYLTVPHPAEEVYKNGMAKGVPLPELAATWRVQ